jgi:DNA polymerase III subunit delta
VIHLLYGSDSYRVRRAFAAIRDELARGDDMLSSNTTVLDGTRVSPDELLAHATAVPFLASNRLVVVEGLIGHLAAGSRRGRRPARDDAGADDREKGRLEAWQPVAAQLTDPQAMPDTTTLVFIEGEVAGNSRALALFKPGAHVQEFRVLRGQELESWVAATAKERGAKLSPGGARLLARLIGPDLWTLSNELDKLATYAGGDSIDERTIGDLVPAAQETKVWTLTDAVVAGDERKALAALHGLLHEGEPPPLIASMLVRAFRQVAVVKDMVDSGERAAAIQRATGVPDFKVDDTVRTARRFNWPQVRRAYTLLLDADLSVKRGEQGDEASLQLVVHQLCALARASRGAPRAAAR